MNALTKQLGGWGLGLALGAAACSTTSFPPPQELVEARAEYAKAASSSTVQLNPDGMRVAKQALDDAEMSYGAEKYEHVQSRALIALKKTQAAEENARAAWNKQRADEANRKLAALKSQHGDVAESNLRSTQQQLQGTQAQLDAERQARALAEQQAKDALDKLSREAAVKKEARGMVITLSGQVLFASGQSTLLPAATTALENVATALKASSGGTIVIEGHTDSQGRRDYNLALSQARAEAVRSFLTSRGVPAEALRAVGVGPDRPIADNRSAEGRANNRRVEIVLPPPVATTAQNSR